MTAGCGMSKKSQDFLATAFMRAASICCILLVVTIVLVLVLKSWPILSTRSLGSLLFTSAWRPMKGQFGFLAFIVGTLWVTVLAMAISVPVSLLSAVYLTEYAGRRIRSVARPVVDLLAGIPPVVHGLWGVLAIVPAVEWLGHAWGYRTTGYSVLAGGVVLAVMVFPIIISVCQELLGTVPLEAREASLALGATRWQMVKSVVVRQVAPGIGAAVVLGFSRALGETMAVLMVVGNVPRLPRHIFDAGYPLPALIANNYGEMMSIPLYDSALMLSALILLVVVLIFNILARAVLRRMESRRV